MSNECTFKRGYCIEHKLKGDKTIRKSKKWGEVKGSYKWIHSSKVVWVCKAKNNPIVSDNYLSPASGMGAPVKD